MWRSSLHGSLVNEPDRVHVRSLASLIGLRIQCCCELWCRLQMWPRELPYAAGAALKKKKKKLCGTTKDPELQSNPGKQKP